MPFGVIELKTGQFFLIVLVRMISNVGRRTVLQTQVKSSMLELYSRKLKLLVLHLLYRFKPLSKWWNIF